MSAKIPYWWRITAQIWWCVWLAENFLQPIRSITQIWVVTHHRYGISAFVSQTLFRGETSDGVVKCQLFSQAKNKVFLHHCNFFLPDIDVAEKISSTWHASSSYINYATTFPKDLRQGDLNLSCCDNQKYFTSLETLPIPYMIPTFKIIFQGASKKVASIIASVV